MISTKQIITLVITAALFATIGFFVNRFWQKRHTSIN